MPPKKYFELQFDIGTIKHLGLQMYSTLPPVIGELVSNAWDADAERVDIGIPTGPLDDASEITVKDDGSGMSDEAVRKAYLVVGRDRRKEEGDHPTPKYGRKLQGRKGIGKFSGFGIARQIEVETVYKEQVSRFVMDYDDLERNAERRKILMPPLPPSGTVKKGTKVTLRNITKFRTRSIDIQNIRRRLARRFSVIGRKDFDIYVNGTRISPEERDLKRLLERDEDGNPYLWEYDDVEIKPETGWKVSGWIGALDRTRELEDGIQRGISIMAREKLVQEPWVFEATVGQQFALSYLVGELHAEFVDDVEDTIGTTRNSLVWDTEANAAFKEWGRQEVNRIAREWAEKRRLENEARLARNRRYVEFREKAEEIGNRRAMRIADDLVREVIRHDVVGDDESVDKVIEQCLTFLEFDAFWDLAEELARTPVENTEEVLRLFREWEVVEAKEMARVTEGRITAIEKLQKLIDENALEVPTLHEFLKEFPWVLDPRWTLVDDEVYFSELLRERFPEDPEVPEEDRRIDFLCVSEGDTLVVVEIKRPRSRASRKQLDQIADYVYFIRDLVERTTDTDYTFRNVVGYLLCGTLVDTYNVRENSRTLAKDGIFVRRYGDLLRTVKKNHKEFLDRYQRLREAKSARQQAELEPGAVST